MKKQCKILLTPISLSLIFAITSCDGGSDDNSQTGNQIATPPENPTNTTASSNNTTTDLSAANVGNQVIFANSITTNVNAVRNSNGGLTPLARNNNLDAIAAAHNVSMRDGAPANADPIQINHDGFESRGEQAFALGFTRFGENVGGLRNFPTSQVVSTFVDGWVNSPGHFKNIIGDYTETGVDVLVDPDDGTIYATQVFAR